MLTKNKVLTLITILGLGIGACSNNDAHKSIEGRWQLTEIRTSGGVIKRVDTVFYSFRKNVFEYLKLTTPTQYFHIFGNYRIVDSQLAIEIDTNSFEPKDCSSCFDWDTNIEKYSIRELNTSHLELESESTIYTFIKY
ncbi:MAG: hypothetical protein RL662_1712 [Bacteroidota bacterium]|jgi:hypothetical protein